jgi:hypothetical protein
LYQATTYDVLTTWNHHEATIEGYQLSKPNPSWASSVLVAEKIPQQTPHPTLKYFNFNYEEKWNDTLNSFDPNANINRILYMLSNTGKKKGSEFPFLFLHFISNQPEAKKHHTNKRKNGKTSWRLRVRPWRALEKPTQVGFLDLDFCSDE